MYNSFFMDLPVPSFVFHSSLLTAKGVNSVVARDGFLFVTENFPLRNGKFSLFFILATLIAQLPFKYIPVLLDLY